MFLGQARLISFDRLCSQFHCVIELSNGLDGSCDCSGDTGSHRCSDLGGSCEVDIQAHQQMARSNAFKACDSVSHKACK